MSWFSGWVEKIVERVVDARMAALDSAKPEIDYDQLASSLHENGLDYAQIASNIQMSDLADEISTESIEDKVVEKIDLDEVAQRVGNEVDMGEISEHVKDNFEFDYSEFDIDYSSLANEVDLSDLASEVKDQIEVDMSELAEDIDYEELAKALIKLASKSVETA